MTYRLEISPIMPIIEALQVDQVDKVGGHPKGPPPRRSVSTAAGQFDRSHFQSGLREAAVPSTLTNFQPIDAHW